MPIILQRFSGLLPKVHPELLPEVAAARAERCDLSSGKVVPRKKHRPAGAVPAGTKTVYKRAGDWLTWNKDVDVIRSPVSNDAHSRIYYSGDGAPRVTGKTPERPPGQTPQNLITNGDFSEKELIRETIISNGHFAAGLEGWEFYPDSGQWPSTRTAENGYAEIRIIERPADFSRLYKTNLSLTAGLLYTVSFRCRASAEEVQIRARIAEKVEEEYFGHGNGSELEETVGIEWQEYSFSYKAKNSVQDAGFFFLPDVSLPYPTQETVFLDDVVIREEHEPAGWEFLAGDVEPPAEIDTSGGEGAVIIESAASNGVYPELRRLDVSMRAGKTYRVTFYGKAETAGDVIVVVFGENKDGSYNVEGYKTLVEFSDTQTYWKKYTLEYTAKQTRSDGGLRFYFDMPLNAGNIWIDRVSVVELSPAEIVSNGYSTFRLGVPAPASELALDVRQKEVLRWKRVWQYQYEEPDGTVSQSGSLIEGEQVFEMIPGQNYRLPGIPPKAVGVSADAMFIAYFDGYSDTEIQTYLGRVYPDISLYKNQTDLYVDGALVSMAQVNSAAAEFTLSFDTSRESEFRKERAYVYTFVTAYGEEGPPSDPTGLIEVSPVQNVFISGLPVAAPSGFENVIKKRLYRTAATAAGTVYQMVSDIDLRAATFTDEKTDAELLGVLSSADWNPPPETLSGLGVTSNGVCFGFTGRSVHFSEPYYPHAWPAKYQFECQSEIVAVKASETGVVVLTKNEPEVIQGDSPATMQRLRLPVQQGCASKRSAVVYRGGVVYATPDGIGIISGMSHSMISDPYFERHNWQEFSPSEMVAAVHNQELLLYSSGTGLIADLKNGILVTDSETKPDCFFQDADNDTLYFVEGETLYEWEGDPDPVSATWRSRMYVFSRPHAPFSIQIQASGYPVTMRFFADDELVLETPVPDARLRKIPVLRRTERWAFEVTSAAQIRRITIGTPGGKL